MSWSVPAAASLIASFTLTGAVRVVLQSRGVIDVPNWRSSHTAATVRGGGIALLPALLIGMLVSVQEEPKTSPQMIIVILGAGLIGSLGFVEDTRGLPVKVRLVSQTLLSAALTTAFIWTTGHSYLLVIPVTVCGVIFINTANFMDGVDGMSAIHGIIAGFVAIVVARGPQQDALTVLGAMVMATFIGFLPWNFPRARIFLGDVGSYTLGGLTFGLAGWVWGMTGSVVVALAPMSIYMTDVAVTIIRRAIQKKPITESHRDHIYQRIQKAYESHGVSSGLSAAATAAVCSTSILMERQGNTELSTAIVGLTLCCAYVLLCELFFLRRPTKKEVL